MIMYYTLKCNFQVHVLFMDFIILLNFIFIMELLHNSSINNLLIDEKNNFIKISIKN